MWTGSGNPLVAISITRACVDRIVVVAEAVGLGCDFVRVAAIAQIDELVADTQGGGKVLK